MHLVFSTLILLFCTALSGLLAKRLPLPLPLLQILIGAILAQPPFGVEVAFDPQLFLLVFIPPLLFADAWRIPKRDLFELKLPILSLALGLVFFTVLTIGFLVHWLIPPISLPLAFALAAVLAPTDAVALSGVVGKLRLPTRLRHVLEGESLLNDASGLVTFKFAIVAALTGTFSLSNAAFSFVMISGGGLLIGCAVGWLTARLWRYVQKLGDDAGAQFLILLIVPFVSYALAEHVGASGILAAVGTGLYASVSNVDAGATAAARLQTYSVWEMLESTFNGLIFLLLGLQLPVIVSNVVDGAQDTDQPIWRLLAYLLVISLALMLVRFVWVWVALNLRHVKSRLAGQGSTAGADHRIVLVTACSGVRGAITLAGVLSIPLLLPSGQYLPGRDLLIFFAAGVILLSLISSSIILPLLLSSMTIDNESSEEREYRSARIAAAESAIGAINDIQNELAERARQGGQQGAPVPTLSERGQALAERMSEAYRQRVRTLEDGDAENDEASSSDQEGSKLTEMSYTATRRLLFHAALQAERKTLQDLNRQRSLSDAALASLLAELDRVEVAQTRVHA